MRRAITSIVLIIVALLLPLSAEATGHISANDSIAGLGITVSAQGLTASTTLDLVLTDPGGRHTTQSIQSDSAGAATANVRGTATGHAGMYSIDIEDHGSIIAGPITVAVLPGTMDGHMSALQSWNPHIAADGNDSAEVTVTVRDAYGNVLAGRPIALVTSRPEDAITALTPETDKDGVQHFAVTTTLPGTIQIRAVDLLSGNTIAASATVKADGTAMGGPPVRRSPSDDAMQRGYTDVSSGRRFYAQVSNQGDAFDLIDSFEILVPSTLPLGQEAPKLTVRAIDKQGNTVENYTGTVQFESTDPNAVLPNFGTYTFKTRDLGQKSFPLVLTFNTPGQHIFRVKDAQNPSIVGEATINVGGSAHGAAGGIAVTSFKDGDKVDALAITVSGTGPAYANLIVMGGSQDATGTTDADGTFSIPITLNANQRDFTIRVRDDAGRNDSGPIHLILDQTPPDIGSITFSPQVPAGNEKVLAVVQSEPGLTSVVMTITDAASHTDLSVTLNANPTASGSYQGFFTAPSTGVYQPKVSATDSAGNATEVRTTLSIGTEGLPVITNVTAEPRVNAVQLQWDAVVEPVDGYRIYVGDSGTNFLYTLDTGRPTTKATVAGLTPGQAYFFAVTAVKGSAESKAKSQIIQATPLGLTLDVTPGNGVLHVKWTTLAANLPIGGFLLQYGIAPDSYTETRMLNGQLRDYTMRDLLNGITYYMQVTPITVTGEKLANLSAKGQGTPSGTGFQPGPRDDIPSGIGTLPGNVKNPPPTNPGSGLPESAAIGTVVLGMLGAVWSYLHRRKQRHATAFLRMIQSQYTQL